MQGILFLFYEPNLDDVLASYVLCADLDELQQAVDKTKCGTNECSVENKLESWGYIGFSNIYRGQVRNILAVIVALEALHKGFFCCTDVMSDATEKSCNCPYYESRMVLRLLHI